jgi:hypothetical protein
MPRTNWHLDVDVDRSDPFAGAQRLDLTEPDLQARVLELLQREGQLYEQGITCPIKERSDSCCSACPLRGSERTRQIRALCELGCQQERALMAAIVGRAT